MQHTPRLTLVFLGLAAACVRGTSTGAPPSPAPAGAGGPATTTVRPPPRPDAVEDTLSARVNALATDYYEAWIAAFPEVVTTYGLPNRRHDRLTDNSASGERTWRLREDGWRARLRQIDPQALIGRPAWVTYGLLREELDASIGMRVCETRLWTVHPLIGWLSSYAELAEHQPVGTDSLRVQALTRWRGLPRFVDLEIENLREGVERGYTEPVVNVRRVLKQLDDLLATPVEQSPFYSPAVRDTTALFGAALRALVADTLNSAFKRYRTYLATDYLPIARPSVSIAINPNGAACYRASIRRYTTLDVAPRDIHRLGLRRVAAAESTMRTIAQQRYGTTDVQGLMRRLRSDSSASFRERSDVVPAVEAIVARVNQSTPRAFHLLPKSPLHVQPFAAFQEPSVPLAQYDAPASDGSRPGIFRVNLRYATQPGERLRMEGLTFHEAIPGHHFQISIAQERTGVHPVTRYLGNSAFIEGWAIYAEQVADEMGLFSSDASKLRWLEDKVYEAVTLVMETGMHTMGWTRDQAIAYELAHTTRSAEQAAIDVDRRVGWPGQGLSYQVGYLEISRLREDARRQLGPAFDLRQFHDRVLEDGTITLAMLRDKIGRWVADTRTASTKAAATPIVP